MIKVRCPICERRMAGASTTEWPEFPFCSPRCRTIDLGRWLGGNYTVQQDPEEEEESPEPLPEEQDTP